MTWTAPKTMGSEIGTSSDWNTYVRDNELYLKSIVDGVSFSGVQVRRAATQAITTATETDVSFDTETLDFGGWWASGTTITVPAGAIPSGYTTVAIILQASAKFASNGTGARRITLLKNGASVGTWQVSALTGDVTDVQVFSVTTVAAADTVKLDVYQTSGGNLNINEAVLTVLRYAPAT